MFSSSKQLSAGTSRAKSSVPIAPSKSTGPRARSSASRSTRIPSLSGGDPAAEGHRHDPAGGRQEGRLATPASAGHIEVDAGEEHDGEDAVHDVQDPLSGGSGVAGDEHHQYERALDRQKSDH